MCSSPHDSRHLNLFCPIPAKVSASGELLPAYLIVSAVTPVITGLIQIRRKNLRTPSRNLCLYYSYICVYINVSNVIALEPVDELSRIV